MRRHIWWLVAVVALMSIGCAGPRQIFPTGGSNVPLVKALKPFRTEARASRVRWFNDIPGVRVRIKFRHQGFDGGIWLEQGAAVDVLLNEGLNEFYVYVDSDRTGRQLHTDWRTIYVNPADPRCFSCPTEGIHFTRSGQYTGSLMINDQYVSTHAGDMYDRDQRQRHRW